MILLMIDGELICLPLYYTKQEVKCNRLRKSEKVPADLMEKKLKHDRTVYTFPDRLYYGRGDVQLTWYENYELMGKLLNYPLLKYPELALEPEISARIMIEGMTRGISNRGDFTGVSLENYFNNHKEDPINARRIINGLDQAKKIADYYNKFLNAIRNSKG